MAERFTRRGRPGRSAKHASTFEGDIVDCLDELIDFAQTNLRRYPPSAATRALGVQLRCLLQAMLECNLCAPSEVRQFFRELEREVFEEPES